MKKHPPLPINPRPMLSGWFVEYQGEMRRRDWRPRTQARYANELKRFIRHVGDKPVGDVDVHQCRSFMELFLTPIEPSTFNLILNIVNGFFRWLVSEGAIEVAPTDRIERAKTVPLRYRKRTRITTEQLLEHACALLGHESVATTSGYVADATHEALKASVSKLSFGGGS